MVKTPGSVACEKIRAHTVLESVARDFEMLCDTDDTM